MNFFKSKENVSSTENQVEIENKVNASWNPNYDEHLKLRLDIPKGDEEKFNKALESSYGRLSSTEQAQENLEYLRELLSGNFEDDTVYEMMNLEKSRYGQQKDKLGKKGFNSAEYKMASIKHQAFIDHLYKTTRGFLEFRAEALQHHIDEKNKDVKSESEHSEEDNTSSLLEKESRIDELARELELIEKTEQGGNAVGISSDALSEKRESIVKEIQTLEDEKSLWLKANGREELPEGISVAEEDGQVLKFNVQKEQTEKMSKEQRRRWIDQWQEKAVRNFTEFFESNWYSRNAVNLPQVLDIIKNNVPLSIERRAKKFLDGTSDFLPDFVFLDWKSTSILDRLIGKPNQIKELKIDFSGGDHEVLATEEDLVDQNQEKEDGTKGQEEEMEMKK